MKTCLLHERTFARLKDRLEETADDMRFALLHDDGTVRDSRTGEDIDAPNPTLAYGNGDIWFGPSARPFFKLIMSSPELDWFQSSAAGVDNQALASVLAKARLYTTNHKQAEAMAEWAIWQALDWLKRGQEHRANQKNAVWQRLQQREIMGARWLIIGYGSIGQAVARRVTALGGEAVGVRRSGGSDPHSAMIVTPDAVMSELPKADIVLLCMPHTPETENYADADFFAAMSENKTLFMNLGRGALVDEAALIAELDRGRPAHAVLDVTATEPLPEASPLWHHPNITITPHESSETHGTLLRGDETFYENLQLYLKDEPLMHLISG